VCYTVCYVVCGAVWWRRKLERKIELLVGEGGQRYDSKRWYYEPVNDRAAPAKRALQAHVDELEGYR